MKERILAKKSCKVLLAILAVVFLCSNSIVKTYAQSTDVRVVPDTLTVGVEGQPMPTEPFTINATVTNVTDLYSWQVCIFYDPVVVNFSDAWLPSGHAFAGNAISEVDPTVGTVPQGTYVFYGCTLQGAIPGVTFEDTRVLAQFNFTAEGNGVTTLNMSVTPAPFETGLFDSDFEEILANTFDGIVTVIPEFPVLSILLAAFVVSGVIVSFLKKRCFRKLLNVEV